MEDLLSFEGQTVVVTGAAEGIGKGAALEFARRGASVALVGHGLEELRAVASQCEELGGQALALAADVANETELAQAMQRAADRFGRIDVVMANAGINGVWAPIDELTVEEFDKTIAVNLRGTFLTIKFAAPYLKKQGGSVIVVSSVNGTRVFSNTGATAYSTSKAGQLAMAKMLAVELGHDKIRVNVICPGRIDTEIDDNTERRHTDKITVPAEHPEGTSSLVGDQPGTIQQVGRLAVFLASKMADHITGEVVYIDAGSSLVIG